MPGYMRKRDNDGQPHLENDILLAYTRGQLSADIVLVVQQHCAKCTLCTRKCNEYTRIGTTLQQNLTYALPVYPSIVNMLGSALDSPEAASVALRQRRENRKQVQKQRISTVRSGARYFRPRATIFPLTISVALIILVVLFIPTLSSYFSSRAFNDHSRPGVSTIPVQPTSKVMTRVTKLSDTPTPTPTMVGVTVTPARTPTPVGTAQPLIWLCSSSVDFSQSRLRICGKGFKAGDRVLALEVLPGISHKVVLLLIADVQGSITGAWVIQNCRYLPIAMYAFDVTHAWFTPPVVLNLSIGGCRSPGVRTWSHS